MAHNEQIGFSLLFFCSRLISLSLSLARFTLSTPSFSYFSISSVRFQLSRLAFCISNGLFYSICCNASDNRLTDFKLHTICAKILPTKHWMHFEYTFTHTLKHFPCDFPFIHLVFPLSVRHYSHQRYPYNVSVVFWPQQKQMCFHHQSAESR